MGAVVLVRSLARHHRREIVSCSPLSLTLSRLIGRSVSRRLLVRAWRLQADDWVMLLVAVSTIPLQ